MGLFCALFLGWIFRCRLLRSLFQCALSLRSVREFLNRVLSRALLRGCFLCSLSSGLLPCSFAGAFAQRFFLEASCTGFFEETISVRFFGGDFLVLLRRGHFRAPFHEASSVSSSTRASYVVFFVEAFSFVMDSSVLPLAGTFFILRAVFRSGFFCELVCRGFFRESFQKDFLRGLSFRSRGIFYAFLLLGILLCSLFYLRDRGFYLCSLPPGVFSILSFVEGFFRCVIRGGFSKCALSQGIFPCSYSGSSFHELFRRLSFRELFPRVFFRALFLRSFYSELFRKSFFFFLRALLRWESFRASSRGSLPCATSPGLFPCTLLLDFPP